MSLSIVFGTPTTSKALRRRAAAPYAGSRRPRPRSGRRSRAPRASRTEARKRRRRERRDRVRDVPRIVPPRCRMPRMLVAAQRADVAAQQALPAVAEPDDLDARAAPLRTTTARITAFEAGQSPPAVSTPILPCRPSTPLVQRNIGLPVTCRTFGRYSVASYSSSTSTRLTPSRVHGDRHRRVGAVRGGRPAGRMRPRSRGRPPSPRSSSRPSGRASPGCPSASGSRAAGTIMPRPCAPSAARRHARRCRRACDGRRRPPRPRATISPPSIVAPSEIVIIA